MSLMRETLEMLDDKLCFLMGELDEMPEDDARRPALTAQIESMLVREEDKIDSIARRLIDLDRKAEACDEEAAQLKSRAAKFEKDRKWLADIAVTVMERNGWSKLEGRLATLTRVKGRERVMIDNVNKLPGKFVKCSFPVHVPLAAAEFFRDVVQGFAGAHAASVGEIDIVPDKRAIGEALKSDEVPGASIEVGPASAKAYISQARSRAKAPDVQREEGFA